MQLLRRIGLFFLINALVVLTVSILLRFFNVQPYLTPYGLDYQSLALFCLIWGMGGALISLLLSKHIAKWMLKVKPIDPMNCSDLELRLYKTVETLARNSALRKTPELGIYQSSTVNAFATGPSQSNSLIALSTGLIDQLTESEIEAVIGHEMSHISNGDMVTMTLIQGIVNAFVMFLARAFAFAISSLGRSRNRRGSSPSFYLCTFLFEIVFMILGSMVIAGFSRRREFRADRGSADLLGKEKMIAALRRLDRLHGVDAQVTPKAVQALMIRDIKKKGSLSLFSTHPSIDERIKKLEEL